MIAHNILYIMWWYIYMEVYIITIALNNSIIHSFIAHERIENLMILRNSILPL